MKPRNIIPLLRGMKNAVVLLLQGKRQEFLVRLRISLGQIDLKHDPTETVTARTHYYTDSGGIEFDRIMANFAIGPGDAIVDFGCGKGGILISLVKYPFAKITGVEIAPELAEIAKRNIRKLKIKNVEIVCCDASEFTELDEFNYFYFYDPFPAVVMQDVIANIEQSIRARPRRVTIIYLNPLSHELIESCETFRKTRELPHFAHKCYVYSNAG